MKKRTTPLQDYQKSVKTNRKRLRHYFISKAEQKQLDNNVFGWNNGIFDVSPVVLISSVAYFSYCAKCLNISLNACRLLFYLASKGIDKSTTIDEYRDSLCYYDSPAFPVSYCRQTKALFSRGLIEKKNKFESVVTSYGLYLLEQLKKDFEGLSALRVARD